MITLTNSLTSTVEIWAVYSSKVLVNKAATISFKSALFIQAATTLISTLIFSKIFVFIQWIFSLMN